MAMIKCPECGKEISDRAPRCPGCGITKADIQKLLQEKRTINKQVTVPANIKITKAMRCPFCNNQTKADEKGGCVLCGYPLYTLAKSSQSVEKGIRQHRKDIGLEGGTTPPPPPPQPQPTPKKNWLPLVLGGATVLAVLAGVLINITGEKKKEATSENTAAVSVSSTEDQTSQAEEEVKTDSQEVEDESLSEREELETEEAVAYNPEEDVAGTENQGSEYKVGDTVLFGSYEQDNNESNGAEEIEWIVLDQKDDSYLLLSKYGLDAVPYNKDWVDVTWETCTLRTWLNEDFYSDAFDEDEQSKIKTKELSNADNPEYGTEGGNDTEDKVFLLSIQDAENPDYFASDEARQAKPTDYAVAKGAWKSDSTECCWWWLRSPGGDSDIAAGVYGVGSVDRGGYGVGDDSNCVRPALWVNL